MFYETRKISKKLLYQKAKRRTVYTKSKSVKNLVNNGTDEVYLATPKNFALRCMLQITCLGFGCLRFFIPWPYFFSFHQLH